MGHRNVVDEKHKTGKSWTMTKNVKFWLCLFCGFTALGSSGCVMKRTVTEGGQVVSQKYIVERPLRDAMKGNSQ